MGTIVVVYDEGAVAPPEIVTGLRDLGEVVFVLPPSPHNRMMAPLIADLGQVVDDTEVGALEPSAVLTFSEPQVPLTAGLTEDLGLPGHSREVAALLTDKRLQRARLSTVDPVPSVVVDADTWEAGLAAVGLPAVLKPVRGMGSRDANLIQSAADIPRLLTGAAMQLERFITGRESGPYGDFLSVESLVCDGRVHHLAVSGKLPMRPPFREVGEFWPAVLPVAEEPAVLKLASAAIEALGVRTGVVHTEIKLSEDGPHLIEVNGRLAGYVNEISTRAAGLDLVHTAGRIALGEAPRLDRPVIDGVHFSFGNLAPRLDGTLRRVQGIGEVSRMPGIARYRRYVRPGEAVHDGVGTQRLDLISGAAADHAGMLALIDRVRAALTFTFDGPAGTLIVSGQELHER